MENNNVTKQEVLKFSAEMEEEASIKLAIAKVCDVNVRHQNSNGWTRHNIGKDKKR